MTEAEVLLADVQNLRQQTRHARRAFELPLVLFGLLILLAPLFYSPAERIPLEEGGYQLLVDQGPFPMFTGVVSTGNWLWVSWYWFLVVVVGGAATAWWYRRHAMRVGIESDTRGYLLAGGAALTAFVLGLPLLQQVLQYRYYSLYSTPALNVPILFGSAIAAGAVFAWCTRKNRTPALRTTGIFFGTLLLVVTFSTLGAYFIKGYSALIIIAAGLLALAWLERSALLAVIAVLFTAASIPANHQLEYWDFPYQFGEWGWGYTAFDDTRSIALQEVLVPGVILLAGAAVAFVVNRRGTRR